MKNNKMKTWKKKEVITCIIVIVLMISVGVYLKMRYIEPISIVFPTSPISALENDDEIKSSNKDVVNKRISERDRKEMAQYNKFVALTFDDGPRSSTTTKLLDTLDKEKVNATFFLLGNNVSGNEDIILRMKKSGHNIGSHTYSHLDLVKQNESTITDEFKKTDDLVYNITKEKIRMIRTPYGSQNDKVMKIAKRPNILWSVDTRDWESRNSEKIIKATLNSVHDGAIILMHDIHEESVNAVPEIIKELHKNGYGIITVEALLGENLGVENYYNR